MNVDAVPMRQGVAAFIESIHSRNGFSRERMDPARAAEFDARVRDLLTPHVDADGLLALEVTATIAFGR